MHTLRELTWLTQLGFSIVSPLLLCLLGSVWLRNRFGLGGWVVALGVLLGLGGALSAGLTFARHTKSLDRPEGKGPKNNPPVSFNEHD